MAIRNVHFRENAAPEQTCSIPQYSQQSVTNPIEKSRPDLISQEGANALRAYTLQNNLNFRGAKTEKTGTSKEYIEQLVTKGLKEGKDFIIDKDGEFTEVHRIKNGEIIKDMVWFQDDTGENFECYRLNYHSKNYPIEGVTTCIGGDGKFRYRTKTYENNPIKNDDVNVNLSPKDYEEYLSKNNCQYTTGIENINDNIYWQTYSVHNPQTDSMYNVIFEREFNKDNNLCIKKEIYNADNEHIKTIRYYDDCTEIMDFKDNLKI